MTRDQKLKEFINKSKTSIRKDDNKLFEELESENYTLGVEHGSNIKKSSSNLISSGVTLVVGIIVLVIVSNVINQSNNGGIVFIPDIGATAFIVVGFITVGIALAMLVRSFATVTDF